MPGPRTIISNSIKATPIINKATLNLDGNLYWNLLFLGGNTFITPVNIKPQKNGTHIILANAPRPRFNSSDGDNAVVIIPTVKPIISIII